MAKGITNLGGEKRETVTDKRQRGGREKEFDREVGKRGERGKGEH